MIDKSHFSIMIYFTVVWMLSWSVVPFGISISRGEFYFNSPYISFPEYLLSSVICIRIASKVSLVSNSLTIEKIDQER